MTVMMGCMTVPSSCPLCGFQGTDAETEDHHDHAHNTESDGGYRD